jgi:hypothetical protein
MGINKVFELIDYRGWRQGKGDYSRFSAQGESIIPILLSIREAEKRIQAPSMCIFNLKKGKKTLAKLLIINIMPEWDKHPQIHTHLPVGVHMLSLLITAFLFIGCGGKDADSAATDDTAAASEE